MINLSTLKIEDENDAQFWKNLLKSSELHNKELSDFIEYLKKSVADQKDKNKELIQENSSLKSQINIKDSIIVKLRERLGQLEGLRDSNSSKTSLKVSDHEFKIYSRLEETKRIGNPGHEMLDSDKIETNLIDTAEKLNLTALNYRSDPTEALTPPPRNRNNDSERLTNFILTNNNNSNNGVMTLNLHKNQSENLHDEAFLKKDIQRKNFSQYNASTKENIRARDTSIGERENKALNKSINDLATSKGKILSPSTGCEGINPFSYGSSSTNTAIYKTVDEKTSKKASRMVDDKGASKENGLFPIFGKIKKRSQSKAPELKKKPPVLSPKAFKNCFKDEVSTPNVQKGLLKAATVNSRSDKNISEGVSVLCQTNDQPNILDKYNKINEKMDNCLGKNKNLANSRGQEIPKPLLEPECTWGQYLYETFMVIGISKQDFSKFESERQKSSKNTVFSCPPTILYKRAPGSHLDETFISQAAQFAFPKGVEAKRCEIRESESEINQILMAKNTSQINENCFIFTLNSQATFTKTNKTNTNQENLQKTNPDHRYYCICIKVKDIYQLDDEKNSKNGQATWISEQIYCFLSYYPFFDFFFYSLARILDSVKYSRLKFMGEYYGQKDKQMKNVETEFHKMKQFLLDDILLKYSNVRAPFDNKKIDFHDEKNILKIPDYITENHDYECWASVSILALSNMTAQEFVRSLSLIFLENSVIFVSNNAALLSSTILSLLLFMRPFRWPYPFVCAIPQMLIQILDSPFPIIGGLNMTFSEVQKNEYIKKYPQCIFINLDNDVSFSNIKKEPPLSSELIKLIHDLNQHFESMKRYKDHGNRSETSYNLSISSNLSTQRTSLITNMLAKSPTTTIIATSQKLIYDADENEKKSFYQCIDVINKFYKKEIMDFVPLKDDLRLSTILKAANKKEDSIGEFSKRFLKTQIFSFFFDENLNKSFPVSKK